MFFSYLMHTIMHLFFKVQYRHARTRLSAPFRISRGVGWIHPDRSIRLHWSLLLARAILDNLLELVKVERVRAVLVEGLDQLVALGHREVRAERHAQRGLELGGVEAAVLAGVDFVELRLGFLRQETL